MDAAVRQAGALQDAAQRIAHLALGLDAAGRLWRRRLPDTPGLRLRIFGPAMGRMLAAGGGTVLERVTSETSALDAAVFSSAAQRLLRDGTARARLSAAGRIDRAALLAAANTPPPPVPKTPLGLPHVDTVAQALGERPLEDALELPRLDDRLERLLAEFEGRPREPDTIVEFAVRASAELGLPCEDDIRLYLSTVLAPPVPVLDRQILLDAVLYCLGQGLPERARAAGLEASLPWPASPADRHAIDLAALSAAVAAAIDPTQLRPPAWERVTSTITGLDLRSLAPPEPPIGLDFPTWTLLNRHEREWLLPGAGSIVPHSIVALQTNPAFVDAFMVGINTQFIAEMRWRNLPAPRVSTPLRMFWGYVNHATGKREPDIAPIGDWPSHPPGAPAADDLGDLTHQVRASGDPAGKRDLVVAFRTPLFRRYPSTLVYLVRPGAADVDAALAAPPHFTQLTVHPDARQHIGPIFFGQVEPDLVFFVFDVNPDDLAQLWLVLDEPPSELRFRNDRLPDIGQADDPNPGLADSAHVAQGAIDTPTRVAISGAELLARALDQ
jgi:hypothetical protein